ncbi:type I restriction endonuclease subunit R [Deinococcus sp. KNUC1210]|uniref:type I restriction endonuclease subunit R n=1 Tax=Deinococcus sp. KNUC1210 TaxID=2917691 RepID=UPI001EF13C83|nr:type I restriction endonuclease subunit R [Deinococcus sp. KNUC1210]ULH16658.1 type I restriction endonuclease subunit R [Deinococcus sp. KNUC1210]
MREYSEARLVEETCQSILRELGWHTLDATHETLGERGTLGRESQREVVLRRDLRDALKRLNPNLPSSGIEQAVELLAQDRSALSAVAGNQELHQLMIDGVLVLVPDEDGETPARVTVIDWEQPGNNTFLAVQQLTIRSDLYTRRPDVIGFVNGLPLVFIELKSSHRRLRNAYRDNLRDYRDTIPHLFQANAVQVLSNGTDAVVGSMTAGWEHFAEWVRVEREDEPRRVGLSTLLRGVCDPARLLDLVENFTVYLETKGGVAKILAKNHQVLGVNNALRALEDARANRGRLGVFWHTQGSGKSLSMVFFSRKVLRKVPGNWSFLIVTDRDELDEQIYTTFARTGTVTENEDQVRAASGAHLRELLTHDHRYLFTLIQKFHAPQGEAYPALSARRDVIVMTDEAHRSQYDLFAGNMRAALPNASFIGFTGTPLMDGEQKTREVFGDYVSVYNFSEAVQDRATVPLYYENRIPELQLTNADLQANMEDLLDREGVDEQAERLVEREFSREYQLITRDDRLEKIAQDLVRHFLGRGQFGKAMVVSIDKATAVRMYDKVQRYWQDEQLALEAQLAHASGDERDGLHNRLRFMQGTDMAVVLSQSQNEVADFRDRGLDITPHRRRMVQEDLEEKFKDPGDPLRLVFVCAMWMTGFDAPSVSTIYLDKPMRNHTLMQTIARANRVWEEKVSGLIVDYVGVFRNLQRALAIYGAGNGSGVGAGDTPVQQKEELLAALRATLSELDALVTAHGIDPQTVIAATGEAKLELIRDATDALLAGDDLTKRFIDLSNTVNRLFKAVLPDREAQEFAAQRALYLVLAERLTLESDEPELDGVMQRIEGLLDTSVAAYGYVIRDATSRLDLSQVDFDKLQAMFEHTPRKRTEAEKLRAALNGEVQRLTRLNKTRANYAAQLEAMIQTYNAGLANVETFFEELLRLGRDLSDEVKRALREHLSEEELAVFDQITATGVELPEAEREQIKVVARALLTRLKGDQLVLDWRKKQQARARVKQTIRRELDALPQDFSKPAYDQAVQALYAHVYESYTGEGESVYS